MNAYGQRLTSKWLRAIPIFNAQSLKNFDFLNFFTISLFLGKKSILFYPEYQQTNPFEKFRFFKLFYNLTFLANKAFCYNSNPSHPVILVFPVILAFSVILVIRVFPVIPVFPVILVFPVNPITSQSSQSPQSFQSFNLFIPDTLVILQLQSYQSY